MERKRAEKQWKKALNIPADGLGMSLILDAIIKSRALFSLLFPNREVSHGDGARCAHLRLIHENNSKRGIMSKMIEWNAPTIIMLLKCTEQTSKQSRRECAGITKTFVPVVVVTELNFVLIHMNFEYVYTHTVQQLSRRAKKRDKKNVVSTTATATTSKNALRE